MPPYLEKYENKSSIFSLRAKGEGGGVALVTPWRPQLFIIFIKDIKAIISNVCVCAICQTQLIPCFPLPQKNGEIRR
jgi:hypothetical protein